MTRRSETHTTDISVLGGLPITVEFTVAPAEPDVGIMNSWVDDWHITHIAGRKRSGEKALGWIYDRLAMTKDEDKLYEDLMSSEPYNPY